MHRLYAGTSAVVARAWEDARTLQREGVCGAVLDPAAQIRQRARSGGESCGSFGTRPRHRPPCIPEEAQGERFAFD